MFAQIRSGKLQSYPHHFSDCPEPLKPNIICMYLFFYSYTHRPLHVHLFSFHTNTFLFMYIHILSRFIWIYFQHKPFHMHFFPFHISILPYPCSTCMYAYLHIHTHLPPSPQYASMFSYAYALVFRYWCTYFCLFICICSPYSYTSICIFLCIYIPTIMCIYLPIYRLITPFIYNDIFISMCLYLKSIRINIPYKCAYTNIYMHLFSCYMHRPFSIHTHVCLKIHTHPISCSGAFILGYILTFRECAAGWWCGSTNKQTSWPCPSHIRPHRVL